MYHVRVTFLLRSRGISVMYLYSYGISLLYVWRIKAYVLRTCDVCMAYVWRMKCTCDVCIGESPSKYPYLKNNGSEAPKGPRIHYFSGMDTYEDFL